MELQRSKLKTLSRPALSDRLAVGLGPQFIAALTLVALVTTAVVAGITVSSSRAALRQSVYDHNLWMAELAGEVPRHEVSTAKVSLELLAKNPLFVRAVTEQDVEQADWHTKQVMDVSEHFDNIALYDSGGGGEAAPTGRVSQRDTARTDPGVMKPLRKDGPGVLAGHPADEDPKGRPGMAVATSRPEEGIQESHGYHARCHSTKTVELNRFEPVARSCESFWLTIVGPGPKEVRT